MFKQEAARAAPLCEQPTALIYGLTVLADIFGMHVLQVIAITFNYGPVLDIYTQRLDTVVSVGRPIVNVNVN